MYKTCQVCGNLIYSPLDMGTESNGELNEDFCADCYKNGWFYHPSYDGGVQLPYTLPALSSDRMWPGYTGFPFGFGMPF